MKHLMTEKQLQYENAACMGSGGRSQENRHLGLKPAFFDFATQKRMGERDFTKIPNGIPSLEERVTLLYSEGVAKGRIDLHRFVDAAATSQGCPRSLRGPCRARLSWC